MAKHYQDQGIVCPFYKYENGNKIMCEGIAPDNTIQISFKNKAAITKHKLFYCWSLENYEKCKLYTAIEEQYKK